MVGFVIFYFIFEHRYYLEEVNHFVVFYPIMWPYQSFHRCKINGASFPSRCNELYRAYGARSAQVGTCFEHELIMKLIGIREICRSDENLSCVGNRNVAAEVLIAGSWSDCRNGADASVIEKG